MADLPQVLPNFDTKPYSFLLSALDRHRISTSDLLIRDTKDIAGRAKLPLPQLQKFIDDVTVALHRSSGLVDDRDGKGDVSGDGNEGDRGKEEKDASGGGSRIDPSAWTKWDTVGMLDERLDKALDGGFLTGYLSEITGESGAGKTQFLLHLLLAVQLPRPRGLSASALYISTESPLPTSRLLQLINTNPIIQQLSEPDKPSLSKILTLSTPDLESQDHILRYQVPVAIQRHNVRLLVIDSIAANFRAELDISRSKRAKTGKPKEETTRDGPTMDFNERDNRLMQLGGLLRNIARTHDICVVVSNQVTDRFEPEVPSVRATAMNDAAGEEPSSSSSSQPDARVLTLEHQQRWFTGWGDVPGITRLKTPALGLVWANQIDCRIALLKEPAYSHERQSQQVPVDDPAKAEEYKGAPGAEWRRYFRVVFAKWAPRTWDIGIPYEIRREGVKAVATGQN